ncbi:MAG: hypothetical protein ABIR96_09025, partial [Bdellovibrionota bacterium]
MALSARTRSVMDIIALVVLTVSPLSLLYFMPVRIPTRTLSLPEAQLRCLKGKCFLLGQETKILMKLPLLVPVRGFFRDKVLTLGTNSELEIIFPDKSKLLQRNTSLLEIQKGRGALLRELEKDPAGGSSEKDPS